MPTRFDTIVIGLGAMGSAALYQLAKAGQRVLGIDPFVPPHIHPTQDEFIYMLEGTFDLYLDGSWTTAGVGDLVRMPRGMPHGYYNRGDRQARALFWVTPARKLRALFEQLLNLGDPE